MSLFSRSRNLVSALVIAGVALGVVVSSAIAAEKPGKKEYLLTAAKPDRLFLIDMKARKVAKEFKIPYNSVAPMTILVSPDHQIAYIVTNHLKAVTGVDLNTGKEVFRADLSQAGDERTINYALAVSHDGKEIFSYELPTILLPDRYDVQPPRISVYRADAGLEAKPTRVFTDVPRRLHMMVPQNDGSKLFALGWDFYTLDPESGKILDTFPLRNWERENSSPPDLLNFWQLWGQAEMFSSLITWVRTDMSPEDMAAYKTGLLTLDLRDGEIDVRKFDIAPEVLFTSVISPDRKTAFAAYNNLVKLDMATGKELGRTELDHSYYITQISGDGSEVYVGGTLCDIAAYSAKDLKKLGTVELPGCPAMGGSSIYMVQP